jgi:inosine-uridine nucleoside N-ribohydrolase
VALQPDIVTRCEHRHVAIELAGVHTRGATVVDWESRFGQAPNARIVLDVDQARFEALVASALA